MKLFTPDKWNNYELLDVGNHQKLERFGKFTLIRPEPQAIWKAKWPINQWEKLAHVQFIQEGSSKGRWKKLKKMPDQWNLGYHSDSFNINFKLALTKFKHVGIFPEQATNWDYIYENISRLNTRDPKFLNLFAYTGGASVVAKLAGADVIHVDSIKQVVSWAKDNMLLSETKDIRWVVEDALKFAKREVKRNKKYNGIILDPPAYGHGPDGEKWKLEEQLYDLLTHIVKLLDEREFFVILNCYSLGISPIVLENLFKSLSEKVCSEFGEVYLSSSTGFKLPLGVLGRLINY